MLDFNKKIIIFGVGNEKKSIATYLAEKHGNVLCVVDNDSRKWGKEINGCPIYGPEHIIQYQNDKDVIVVVATLLRYHDEIKAQLIDMGWDESKIVIAVRDNPFFKSIEFNAYRHSIDLYNPIPTLLHVELSGYCNCRCIYCPFHGEPNLKEDHKGFMTWETLDAIIECVRKIPSIDAVSTVGPGEIFLNKIWFEMLEKLLVNTNIKHVIMYTNGMLLNDENIKKISMLSAEDIQLEVSIDGTLPEENDEYRIGAKYDVIRNNVHAAKKFFDSIKHKIEIKITNCYPATLDEIEASNYKLDSKHSSIPLFLENDFAGIALASQKTFYYGKGELSKFDIVEVEWPEEGNEGCVNLFYRLPINYKGELLRCSCGQAGIEGIGNVFSDDVLELWHNDKAMEKARENFINQAVEEDFCTGCPGKRKGKYGILIKK